MTFTTYAARLAGLSSFALALALNLAIAQPAEKPFEPTVGQEGKDVVWVPTPQALVDRMLDMAKLTPNDIHYDLGSGDGRTVITAAKRGSTAFGVEFNPKMVELSRANANKEGVTDKATFVQGDIFQTDFSKANVITLFLLPELNERLRPTILDMKPGTRVVSNSFSMGSWQPDERAEVTEDCKGYCRAMLWIVPAKVDGAWTIERGTSSSALSLKQEFQSFTGTITDGNVITPVTGGTLKGDEISFTAAGVEFTGKVDGGTIAGTTKSGETWQARRGTPAAVAQAPAAQAPAPQAPAAVPDAAAPKAPAPEAAPAASPDKAAKTDPAPFEPQISQDGKDVVWWPTANTLVNKMLDLAEAYPQGPADRSRLRRRPHRDHGGPTRRQRARHRIQSEDGRTVAVQCQESRSHRQGDVPARRYLQDQLLQCRRVDAVSAARIERAAAPDHPADEAGYACRVQHLRDGRLGA